MGVVPLCRTDTVHNTLRKNALVTAPVLQQVTVVFVPTSMIETVDYVASAHAATFRALEEPDSRAGGAGQTRHDARRFSGIQV